MGTGVFSPAGTRTQHTCMAIERPSFGSSMKTRPSWVASGFLFISFFSFQDLGFDASVFKPDARPAGETDEANR